MSIYTVSVIPQNLRREETVIQIAESLNYLSDVTHDIFKRISNRLEANNRNLNNLQDRIDKVSNRISILSVAKKATQVFSSCKYPGAELNKPYDTVFQVENCPVKTKFPIKYKEVQIKEEPLEKLQFFHITSSNDEKIKSDGLGNIPSDIDCINDFLLYNSGKNPYSEYVLSDTLQTSHISKKPNILERQEIEAAPLSISESATLTKIPGENYFYSPDLGDVPTIDVPVDLPDLPGIADDLRYTDDTGPGIAPSVTTTPNIPNLPHFERVTETSKVIKPQQQPPPVQEVIKEVLVQPLVELPQIETAKIIKEEVEPVLVQSTEAIRTEPEKLVKPEIKKPMLEITDVHANLMDAIRKAGGLKNAKLRSTETKEASEEQSPRNGLMAEFHTKLSLRRIGISGAKKSEFDAGSAMGRISEMLIPPPAKAEQSESVTTDDEWD